VFSSIVDISFLEFRTLQELNLADVAVFRQIREN